MRRFIFVFAVAALALTQQALASQDPVMAPIDQVMNGFNAGNVKAVLAACAPSGVTIIDDVSPFAWQGRTAMTAWLKDLAASESKAGISGGKVSFGAPIDRIVEGNNAYVVIPTVYHFQQHGHSMHDTARMSFALHKIGKTWFISAWAWAGSTPVPAP